MGVPVPEDRSTSAPRDRRAGDVLVVEDTLPLSTLYQQYLRNGGFRVTAVGSGAECVAALAEAEPAVVVLDLGLPDMSGLDILKDVKTRNLTTSVVVITSNGSLSTAVEAMRLGAFDYVAKPFDANRLCATVANAAERFQLRREVTEVKRTRHRRGFHGFIGQSEAMQAVYRAIENVACSKATVFITGESGTGKEVCAAAIHASGNRHDKPFVALNCAAIPRELMESEIFGHVKGAFSGATSDRVGAASLANGGVLFLDEVCEMDLDLQAKLLRLLQSGTFQRVGSSLTEATDIRVICATNRNPMDEVRSGRFREDLFYRLHVIPIKLPALRDRGDDVLLIAQCLLDRIAKEEGRSFSKISEDARAAIAAHSWPGNVRELQNAIRHAIVMNSGDTLEARMLPLSRAHPASQQSRPLPPPPHSMTTNMPGGTVALAATPDILPLWQVERAAIVKALAACNGNVTRAAALLEIGASTLYRKKAELDAHASNVS
jgi:two-component system repressor protein LuxO